MKKMKSRLIKDKKVSINAKAVGFIIIVLVIITLILFLYLIKINEKPSLNNMVGTYQGAIGGDGDGLIIFQTNLDGTCIFGTLVVIGRYQERSTECRWWIDENSIFISPYNSKNWGDTTIELHILDKDKLLIDSKNNPSINNKTITRTSN